MDGRVGEVEERGWSVDEVGSVCGWGSEAAPLSGTVCVGGWDGCGWLGGGEQGGSGEGSVSGL